MAVGTMADGSRPGNRGLGSQFRRQNLWDPKNALRPADYNLDELQQFVQVTSAGT